MSVVTMDVALFTVGFVVFCVNGDVRPQRAHTAALHPLPRCGIPADIECSPGVHDVESVCACVDQRRQQHVASDTGTKVEPHSLHRLKILATATAAPNPLSMPTTVTPLAHDACIASSAVTPWSPAP